MVATDAPGCCEIAIQGETALTVPVGDATALADAMGKLTGDPELRKTFGANARRLVESKFSAEAIGRETVALYDELVAR
jgi:glycosyltransferase involved in cell wall biosynthesis